MPTALHSDNGMPLFPARTCPAPPDLTPLRDQPLQWWFVQGALDRSGDSQRRYFMMALFRTLGGPGKPPDYMLLMQLLNGAGWQGESCSRITPGVRELVRGMVLRLAAAHLPRPLSRLLAELHMYLAKSAAQRSGVELAGMPEARSDGFALTWDGIALAQEGREIHLQFPMQMEKADLVLTCERPWLDETSERLNPGVVASYRYQCCPRLSVRGTLGGREVSGRAWMDRQWGSVDGWLLTRLNGNLQPLGWDWFGLSFDSGEDLMVMRHFLPGEPGRRNGYALLFDKHGALQVGDNLEAKTLRSWQSARTGIAYPIRQMLWLPALSAEIEVIPFADDQEIPVLGLPAMWQGAVRVDGCLGQRSVSGHGRLELFGYGYAPSISAYLGRALRRMFAG